MFYAIFNPAESEGEQKLLAEIISALDGRSVIFAEETYALRQSTGATVVNFTPVFKKPLALRGITRPLFSHYQPVMTSSPPAMPVLIFDEVFSSMMIHALWLKKHFRARVYIYCFENLPFPPLRNLLAKFFVKYLDGAFCSCREAAQRLHELGLKNLQICPFPVREPAPDKIKTIRTIKTVAYLGRLLKEKGVLELCEAMKSFPALELLIAGRGELEKELSHYKINYLGALSPDTIDDFYARIEVLAVPSQTTPGWKEQYGRVIAEAMARGVIVIGSDSGSIPELIGDPKLIFREKSIDAIIDKIKYLTSLNPEELNSISQALRQRYQDHLSNNAFKNILIKGFGSS